MGLKIDTVVHACRLISRKVRDSYKNLDVHFIVHHEGQRTEALGVAAQELIHHPAASTAMHILQRQRHSEDSVLLGTAVARQNMFFGLATRDQLLALCTMNLDQFDSLKEARRHAYHLVWHAIDALTFHSNPKNRTGAATEIIIRRRTALEMALANLQADTFSAAISALNGDGEAIKRMAYIRSASTLAARSLQNPELYPFAISAEATQFAFKNLKTRQLPKKKLIPSAHKLAEEIAKTFDESAVEHWLAFSEPAQEMAWRGYTGEEILSAAINTSPNTYVRATSYLVSETTGTVPSPIMDIRNSYSPFADKDFNEKLHERAARETFEDVIAQGLKQNSSIPFLKMASKQNEALTEGRASGWCAAALHAAAHAYEQAVRSGVAPEDVVRREFESERKKVSWQNLDELSVKIVAEKRNGHMVTLRQLAELSANIEGIKEVQKSIEMSLKDPLYQQKLAAINEMTPDPRQAPARPDNPDLAPTTHKIQGPAASYAAQIPGLGGSSQQRTMPPQTTTEAQPDESGDSARRE